MRKPVIGITMGDVAGIGPEITARAVFSSIKNKFTPVIYGFSSLFDAYAKMLGYIPEYVTIEPGEEIPLHAKKIIIVNFGDARFGKDMIGKADSVWGKYAMEFVRQAALDAIAGRIAAVVTAPINKQGIHLAGFDFPGHTEYLAGLCDTKNYAMMLVSGRIRVALVTIHQSIRSVPDSISRDGVERTIRLTDDAVRFMGIKKPRIAVSALNPHAGEGGAFGSEEKDVIRPAVETAIKDGIDAAGPLPADTLFYHIRKGRYDAAVAMYHDQGLIPLKMAGFEKGVNITLGLPIIRTSPDHGTAYDIAGKFAANPDSMIEAVKLAVKMAKNRKNKEGYGIGEKNL